MPDDDEPKVGGATASPGYSIHDDMLNAFGLSLGKGGIFDMVDFRQAAMDMFGGDKSALFRSLYMNQPQSPHPEEALDEETAVSCLDDLRRRFGDSRVLDTLIRALFDMGDLASTLMVARAELVSRDQRDIYRYEPREKMPKTDWRQRPETSTDFRVTKVDYNDIMDESSFMPYEPTGRKPAGKNPKQFTDFRDSEQGRTKFGKPK